MYVCMYIVCILCHKIQPSHTFPTHLKTLVSRCLGVGHLIDPWLTILDAQKVLTHSEAHSRIETVISSAMQELNGKKKQ
jgi:uncharacterized membrane protein